MSRKKNDLEYESDGASDFESSEEYLLRNGSDDEEDGVDESEQLGGKEDSDDEEEEQEYDLEEEEQIDDEDDKESDVDSEADTELRDDDDGDAVESDGDNLGEEGDMEDGETPNVAVSKTSCHLKDLDKEFLVLDEDDSAMYGKMKYVRVPDEDRISEQTMTYYEMVRIIGTRAQQFNYGAPPLVKGLEGMAPVKMAYVELISNMTPYIVRRHLPGKRYEEWHVSELIVDHVITDKFFVPENFNLDKYRKLGEEMRKTFQEKKKSK